jgi:hypothetical protein
MIKFACAACGRRLKVRDEQAGKKGRCPHCGCWVAIPTAVQAGTSSPAGPDEDTLPPRDGAEEDPLEAQTLPGTGPEEGERSADTVSPHPGAGGTQAGRYDFLAPAQSPDELGRLGPYRVLRVLGAGGMGVVFQAEDPQLRRLVALKAMLPGLAANPSARERFLREARAAAALKHDHVVTIYQVGEDRGAPFLAMELLEGESLDDRLQRQGKLAIPEALRVGRELAEGLQAAHDKGLIHRDVKPANVWLEGVRGRVKILDFGLARAPAGEPQLTQLGAILGTPAYMAPEQAAGRAVDLRCDVFSLGCVLYRACTGELPFKGDDPISTLVALATEQPRPPREVNPDLPETLSELILHLLAKLPEDRRPSAEAVASALREIEGSLLRTLAAALVGPKGPGVETLLGPPPLAAPPPPRAGKGRWLLGGLLAAGVLGVTGLLAWVGGVGRRPADTDEEVSQQPQKPADPPPSPAGPPKVQPAWTAEAAHEGKGAFQVALSADGRALLTGGVNRRLRRWDPVEGKPLPSVPLQRGAGVHEVHGIVIAPNGSRFATLEPWPQRVGVWGMNLRQYWAPPREKFSRSVQAAFSFDGTLLAVKNGNNTVSIWDVPARKEVLLLPAPVGSLQGLRFGAKGRMLVGRVAGPMSKGPNVLALWDTEKPGNPKQVPAGPRVRTQFQFTPDGKKVVAVVGGVIRRWQVPSLQEDNTRVKVEVALRAPVIIGPAARAIVGVGDTPTNLAVCDAATGKRRAVLVGLDAVPYSLTVTRDGNTVAAACRDGSLRSWRLPQAR